ncbi:FAD-dependent oxidoreductase [Oceanomicrobium pacificus]|uniref:FAD-dependent oxidoreductase n=1 Tax=Oceanomicrobium pacificus TaxID=2692916 RepID=A0A6B0TV74_9RHOB|nr:FAD-dependent oxidoreductase [Oceanomicrobium pacificus]MXU65034.1 FAD-dependent oxidoreductase [Oceanomicrobium pacificus]
MSDKRPQDARGTVRRDADVIIVGAGAAGVAAAVTAARQGLRTVLLERYGFCGGGAVAGLSGTVCGIYEATDDAGAPPRKAVFGFLDTFIAEMEARGGLGPPVRYGKTFTRVHDQLIWREAADALLESAGVEIFFHTTVAAVTLDGDRVLGVTAHTKEGTFDFRAPVTIDASGDADVTAMAGFPNFIGDEGRVQNPTMIFRLLGVDVDRFLARYGSDTIMPPDVTEMIQTANAGNEYRLPRSKIWMFTTTRPGELLANCTRIVGRDGRELNPLFAADFTEAEVEGRRQMREYARFFRDHIEGCEDSFVNDTGVQVGVRQTRQIDGVYRLRNADVTGGAKFADGIARSPWPIELHAGAKPKVHWLLNDVYEVPYRCFVPARGEGLIAAGRCLSAEHEAVASARVTAQCFSYGHAIGHAAAICVKEGLQPRDVDGARIRRILNDEGARLDG